MSATSLPTRKFDVVIVGAGFGPFSQFDAAFGGSLRGGFKQSIGSRAIAASVGCDRQGLARHRLQVRALPAGGKRGDQQWNEQAAHADQGSMPSARRASATRCLTCSGAVPP